MFWMNYIPMVLAVSIGTLALWSYMYSDKPPTFNRVLFIGSMCGVVSGFFISRVTFRSAHLWFHILSAVGGGLFFYAGLKMGKYVGMYDRKG
jgi:hypothetical protein